MDRRSSRKWVVISTVGLAALLAALAGCNGPGLDSDLGAADAGPADSVDPADVSPDITPDAQPPRTGWVKTAWSTGMLTANLMAGCLAHVDKQGNIYVTGDFSGKATFGAYELKSNGLYDVFVVKFNPYGEVLWAVSGGGADWDMGFGVTGDAKGNVYITGSFEKAASFGSEAITAPGTDAFVVKVSSEGKVEWARSVGANTSGEGRCVAADGSGDVIVVGSFDGQISDGLKAKGGRDIFVTKLRPDGTARWISTPGGGSLDEHANAVALDKAGNIHIVGMVSGTATFGAAPVSDIVKSNGLEDILVLKLTSTGATVWARSGGGSDIDRGADIAVDSKGNAYIGGHIRNKATFGTHLLPYHVDAEPSSTDLLIAKITPTGDFEWAQSAGGVFPTPTGFSSDYITGVTLDDSENPIFFGNFAGTLTLDGQSYTTTSNYGLFVSRYNPNGTLKDFVEAGALSGGRALSRDITFSPGGDLVMVGRFNGQASFDGNLVTTKIPTTKGWVYDLFVWKRALLQP